RESDQAFEESTVVAPPSKALTSAPRMGRISPHSARAESVRNQRYLRVTPSRLERCLLVAGSGLVAGGPLSTVDSARRCNTLAASRRRSVVHDTQITDLL